MAVNWIEKFVWRHSGSSVNRSALLLLLLLYSSMIQVTLQLEMERTRGGLQVTLQAGEYIKADPRCIVSRGAGLALRPPPAATVDDTGLLSGLKRRIRKAHGRRQQQQQQEGRRVNPLQRLSNTMASNATDCFLTPLFPGDIALVSVSSGRGKGESDGGPGSLSTPPLQPRSRSRTHIDTDMDTHRSRRALARKQEKGRKLARSKTAAARSYDPESKPRKLVVLTQAIVAVGPGVTVRAMPMPVAMPSEGRRRGAEGGGRSSSPRGVPAATSGALSVCEGEGKVVVAGYGRLQALRLRPGQKRVVVDSSRAVGWTSGAMCLAGAGGRTSRSSGGSSSSSADSRGTVSPSAVATFVGPGTVYVQTHSLSGLRRLLLPKPGAGGSSRGHGGGVSSSLHGARSVGRNASPAPRRGGIVGLSLKRGLAKRAKAGAKRVLLGLAFLALYAVVTALLLEGRDGLVKAPRHAVQVARSLMKVVRRVAMILMRLAREELWSNGEGEGEAGGGGGGGASLAGNLVER